MRFVLNWLRGYSIRSRMLGAVVVLVASFAVIGVAGGLAGQRIVALNKDFIHHSVHELEEVAAMRHALAAVQVHEKKMVIDYDDAALVTQHQQVWTKGLGATTKSLNAMLEGPEDDDNAIAREALAHIAEYQKRTQTVLGNIAAGAYDSAKVADKMLIKAHEALAKTDAAIDRIEKLVKDEVEETQKSFEATITLVLLAFGGTLGVIVLVVVPLALLNSHSITSPIGYAAEVAQAIADGDLTRSVRIEGRDEATTLLAGVVRMQESLRTIVQQLRDASDQIGVASAEVATGNQDLSQRTEHTASQLQHASSSMSQLTTTVRQSADSAQQANQLAASAAEVAQRGGNVVTEVVTTMDRIHTSSRKIADIIGTIDGIAFQTNILALNAAVEAARAGEQGRGFAVVASEVRSLAGRSADAAREIKTLIGASVENVENGSKLVADAGQTMNEIVASVQRVSDIIGEISAAASEQSSGIALVNTSVTQLDQMTQQNAALVEQSAAAAESLKEQAVKLAATVARFKVDANALREAASAERARPPISTMPTTAAVPV